MRIVSGSKLLFVGDSITDCNRSAPGAPGEFGTGFVSIVRAALLAAANRRNIRVMNAGISGNTVRDLADRWQSDVVDQNPDWVSIMIGINDIWRQFDPAKMAKAAVLADEYESTLNRLVAQIRPTLLGLVMMTPFFVEPDGNDSMRRCTDEYGAIVRAVAEAHDAILIDTQAGFDRAMQGTSPAELAQDRVHPTARGHELLARMFLGAVGFQ
jgi:lysophospholipase L1-like esterase